MTTKKVDYKTPLIKDLSLKVLSRNTGKGYQVINGTTAVTLYSYRKEKPAKLVFKFVDSKGISFNEGDTVYFRDRGLLMFKGYVFKHSLDERGVYTVTCYDQLRYLRARQSYSFSGYTASKIIKRIAADLGLKCGTIVDTRYRIPSLIADEKTCLDTIYRALEATTAATGKNYVFYDNGGKLTLTAVSKMGVPYVLGTTSFTQGYDYETSIDGNVYNYVKLVRPGSSQGKGKAFVAKSKDTIKKWGTLQYYDRVSADYNEAQVRELAKTTLRNYNKLQQNLAMTCLGIAGVRGGNVFKIVISDTVGAKINKNLQAEKIVHHYKPNGHLMDIDFSIVKGDTTKITTESFTEYVKTAKEKKKSKSGSSSKSSGKGVSKKRGGYSHPFHSTFVISTPFGKKGKAWKCGFHTGADYVGIGNKKVYAIHSGTVTKVSFSGSYGRHVIVSHTDGYVSLYAHLSQVKVKKGQKVTCNTQLGVEGSTGNAFGSHLHLELHKGSYKYPPSPKVNPYIYIESHKG